MSKVPLFGLIPISLSEEFGEWFDSSLCANLKLHDAHTHMDFLNDLLLDRSAHFASLSVDKDLFINRCANGVS